MSKINEMRLGFETAYIDGSVVSSSTYRPQFVSNNHKEGKKVLSSIDAHGFQPIVLALFDHDTDKRIPHLSDI